jgi:hypothetical protein
MRNRLDPWLDADVSVAQVAVLVVLGLVVLYGGLLGTAVLAVWWLRS